MRASYTPRLLTCSVADATAPCPVSSLSSRRNIGAVRSMAGVIMCAVQVRPRGVADMQSPFGTRVAWERVQPFTEPAVMPETIWRWKNRKRISGGTVTSRMSMNSRL